MQYLLARFEHLKFFSYMYLCARGAAGRVFEKSEIGNRNSGGSKKNRKTEIGIPVPRKKIGNRKSEFRSLKWPEIGNRKTELGKINNFFKCIFSSFSYLADRFC